MSLREGFLHTSLLLFLMPFPLIIDCKVKITWLYNEVLSSLFPCSASPIQTHFGTVAARYRAVWRTAERGGKSQSVGPGFLRTGLRPPSRGQASGSQRLIGLDFIF